MREPICLLAVGALLSLNSLVLGPATADAQSFDILDAGELDFESDLISDPGRVTRTFGMNVAGFGQSTLRVTIGDQSADDPYEFRLSSTQLFSFLFRNDLAELVSIPYRRGVFGTVVVSVLDADGVLSDQTSIELDVDLGKANCRKHPSPKLKKCKRIDLARATKAQRRRLARVFVSSIRGPIILEP